MMKVKKRNLAILKNEREDEHLLWEAACRERSGQVNWKVVDLTRADWLEQMKDTRFDGMLARPPAHTTAFRTLYDERVSILHQELGLPVYPSLPEILIYENKKYFSYWLRANRIPHPKTWVFYYQKEALDFLADAAPPLVGKTNIGASGRGVTILRSSRDAETYVRDIFSGKGAPKSVGPNLRKKGLFARAAGKLLRPRELKAKLRQYQHLRADVQKDFVILQEFIPHQYEWRCVRIGDSFFAHKKIVQGEKASGSLEKGYENPPFPLLDFIRKITDRHQMHSQCIDLFETADGRYLVNEMQCIFGQSDPYQMLVDGEPGRYRYLNGQWRFEAGDYNRLQSYLLRLDDFLAKLTQQQAPITP